MKLLFNFTDLKCNRTRIDEIEEQARNASKNIAKKKKKIPKTQQQESKEEILIVNNSMMKYILIIETEYMIDICM